jgi:CHAT domain-containing protein/tetratricopeptide (TPR) repeat protein
MLTLSLLVFAIFAAHTASGFTAGRWQDGGESAHRDSVALRLGILNEDLAGYISMDQGSERRSETAEIIEGIISSRDVTDTLLLSDSYYFLGHHYLLNNSYDRSLDNFALSAEYRDVVGLHDRRYALSISNMSIALFRVGDFNRAYRVGLKGLQARKALSESDSSALAANYLNLSSICLEMNDPGRAIGLAEAGLRLANVYPGRVPTALTADLYQVIGLSLYRTSEYTKSLAYCRESLRLYDRAGTGNITSRLLILNTIAQLHRRLNQPEEAEVYFRRGLSIDAGKNIQDKALLYINYADLLAEEGRPEEGERVLADGLDDVDREFGTESREYCMMLVYRADFLHETTKDIRRVLQIYDDCFEYAGRHPWDLFLKKLITLNYAGTLLDAGDYERVLEVSNEIWLAASEVQGGRLSPLSSYSENDMGVLMARYRALDALAETTGNSDYLGEAVRTGRLIVSLYDRLRLEMSEDESRTRLSAFSRELYTGIIENYYELYERNRDAASLEGIFEFSERSKVAGFLASMRELNAAKFSLPPELVEMDNGIRQKAGLYRELIASEQQKAAPDTQRIKTWESVTFSLLRSRDSLERVFEENYPSYYNLKFQSEVSSLKAVPDVVGRGSNLISYVLTDERLYIIVSNSRHTEVIRRDADSSLISSLVRFRNMLSAVPATSGSRQPFNEYMDLAYELYRELLEPAVPYIKGDKIVISPDNILSYIPFETLVTEAFRSPELLYREVPFALKSYRFSYIYSVTFTSETMGRSRKLSNKLAAFAPDYDGMELDDSLLTVYPNLRGEIRHLPYALIEAEDAVAQCGGRAFLGAEATEEAYKSEAGRYDIVHLAMHTLVDDRHPLFSKMIFSSSPGSAEDGMLNTYEVYSVTLNAMMVVLSSCNTGNGILATGEGILSLARGFLYAGSRSVVMSMWAVDDNSASEVMRSFYRNMRSGQAKSTALRSARLKFLRSADQTRSHPYFWSALVIYGDDTPLWYDSIRLYAALLFFFIAAAVFLAIIYRVPRS